MNIAIVDDSAGDALSLRQQLERYGDLHLLSTNISVYSGAAALLKEFTCDRFQICFLDICMSEMDGLRLAAKLREVDDRCLIVFTTASAEYAVDAYSVRAFHYLLKPITYAAAENAMELCRRTLGSAERYIRFKSGREWRRLPVADILYTDYSNHYIYLYARPDPAAPLRTASPFDRFAPALLAYPQFLNCYRNMLINMDEVTQMNADSFLLSCGVTVPMWRNRKKELREQYAQYMFQRMNRR